MDPQKAKDYSKLNRKNLTPAEATLWKYLKGKQLQGRKFRRQHNFGYYIVDFYCMSEKLVVELDGGYHENRKKEDEQRDKYLRSLGLTVLRFGNEELFDNPQKLLSKISGHFKNIDTE